MCRQYLLVVCLLAICGFATSSGTKTILLTNGPNYRSWALARDSSFSINVTLSSTNMNTTMVNDATTTLTNACRLYTAVADQETYFRTNFATLYPSYNWSIFEHCGTYALYTDYYIILGVTIVSSNTTTTDSFLIFSS